MAVPMSYGPVRTTVPTGLWIAAIAVSIAPWILTPGLIGGARIGPDAFFLLVLLVAATALALAVAALAAVRRIRAPVGLFAVAVGLLAVNLGLAGLAGYAWWTIPTCGGGLSGPCFTPLVLCGGGLIFTLVAAILVGIGLVRLRRFSIWPIPPRW